MNFLHVSLENSIFFLQLRLLLIHTSFSFNVVIGVVVFLHNNNDDGNVDEGEHERWLFFLYTVYVLMCVFGIVKCSVSYLRQWPPCDGRIYSECPLSFSLSRSLSAPWRRNICRLFGKNTSLFYYSYFRSFPCFRHTGREITKWVQKRWQTDQREEKLDFHRQAFTFLAALKRIKTFIVVFVWISSLHSITARVFVCIKLRFVELFCSLVNVRLYGFGLPVWVVIVFIIFVSFLFLILFFLFFFFFRVKLRAHNDYSPRNLFRISFLTTQFIFINFPLLAKPTNNIHTYCCIHKPL